MDCTLDFDTMDYIGKALRDTYQVEIEDEIPNELARLCAELNRALSPSATGSRH